MLQRPFGAQGFDVSVLGFGAGQIGDAALSEDHVGTLLNRAIDRGVTLVDTARGYGLSEERIGRHLSYRRQDFILSTKVGYGVPGFADWTYDGILAGVDQALQFMRTDYIDIVHLHSCPLATLQQGDVIRALHRAKDMGKIRVVAYSGENAELEWAVNSGHFGGVECSINVCDQRSLLAILPQAQERGIGVIAKRSVANAPWRYTERPVGEYCEEYWARLQAMALNNHDMPWSELALRFSAFAPGVSSAIVGTTRIEHLTHNLEQALKGPLPEGVVAEIRAAFKRCDHDWISQL